VIDEFGVEENFPQNSDVSDLVKTLDQANPFHIGLELGITDIEILYEVARKQFASTSYVNGAYALESSYGGLNFTTTPTREELDLLLAHPKLQMKAVLLFHNATHKFSALFGQDIRQAVNPKYQKPRQDQNSPTVSLLSGFQGSEIVVNNLMAQLRKEQYGNMATVNAGPETNIILCSTQPSIHNGYSLNFVTSFRIDPIRQYRPAHFDRAFQEDNIFYLMRDPTHADSHIRKILTGSAVTGDYVLFCPNHYGIPQVGVDISSGRFIVTGFSGFNRNKGGALELTERPNAYFWAAKIKAVEPHAKKLPSKLWIQPVPTARNPVTKGFYMTYSPLTFHQELTQEMIEYTKTN
jgi:hypothetical protein